ncbi:zinc-dependent peptidase [Algoriphagus aestuariicola]|uniref:Zinc-dependent peptidase n=1 Tax=Algoriphagus aestuariicola TaxID=1852016 RepID=A0ABS3BX02_9BACT|nr:M90 family metallopeptidase [Algoriphagus aestuariicola]MBN7803329.1 zinc-dependent peptidase [Algoriphagus aestuariicola]
MIIFTLLFATALLALLAWAFFKPRKSGLAMPETFPRRWQTFLAGKVRFYQELEEGEKREFERKVVRFLGRIRITGVKTEVSEEDRLLVASSAVIPIFRFPEWEYKTLVEVLLYPDLFTEEFNFSEGERNIAGMAGSGGMMSNLVIFSKPALWLGFENQSDKHNVGIHEFIHLFDKEDGEVDGVPAIFMKHQAILPWINLIKKNTEKMLEGKSDINIYGATNPQEFLAVTGEYFFERPRLFKEKHPELYAVLSEVFRSDPAGD